MGRIAVGTDGSAVAAAALRWAASRSKASGAEILAINAFQNPYSEVRPEDHDRLVAEPERLMERPWPIVLVPAN